MAPNDLGLTDLPIEKAIEILKLLHFRDLIRCTSICRQLHAIVKGSLELQYIIELGADGMVDNPTCQPDLSTADRLAQLLDHRRRWRALDWTSKNSVHAPGPHRAYQLVNGVFAKFMSPPGSGSHLLAVRLPSRANSPSQSYEKVLNSEMRDFTVDPSQDLVVLLSVTPDSHTVSRSGPESRLAIYLRTLSTNVKHPKAKQSSLVARVPSLVRTPSVQVADDVLAVFFGAAPKRSLLIWNWRTSEMLVRLMKGSLPPGTCDFVLLSSRTFMLTTTSPPGAIELYSFSRRSPSASERCCLPRRVATLQLPLLRDGQQLYVFGTHSNPALRTPLSGKLFQAAPESHVQFMTLQYGVFGPQMYMCVQNGFLSSVIAKALRLDGTRTDAVWPWESWGPAHTRIFPQAICFKNVGFVGGSRVVVPCFSTDESDPSCSFSVWDFNVYPRRLDDPLPLSDDILRMKGAFKVVSEPTTLLARHLFQEDVVTCLPYSVSSRPEEYDYMGFMIDEDRIIALKSTTSRKKEYIDVFVF